MPNTKLQMLLRGQNLVGYRHYADDVLDKFIERSAANGIDVFRIFDALNDVRNLDRAIREVKACGKHVEATICYTVSPRPQHRWLRVKMAKRLEDLGDRHPLYQRYGRPARPAGRVPSPPSRNSKRPCMSRSTSIPTTPRAWPRCPRSWRSWAASTCWIRPSRPLAGGTSHPPTEILHFGSLRGHALRYADSICATMQADYGTFPQCPEQVSTI
jgi:hypothetical protein